MSHIFSYYCVVLVNLVIVFLAFLCINNCSMAIYHSNSDITILQVHVWGGISLRGATSSMCIFWRDANCGVPNHFGQEFFAIYKKGTPRWSSFLARQ